MKGRCRRRRKGWCKGREGWSRRRKMGFGRGFVQMISKPISSIKTLFERKEVIEKAQEIYYLLPKRDCGACGYDNCYQCAIAIARGDAPPDACKVVGKKIKEKVENILGETSVPIKRDIS